MGAPINQAVMGLPESTAQEAVAMPRKLIVPRIDFSNARPFKIDGVYCKLLHLTRGQFVIVDASDYPNLNSYPWYAKWYRTQRAFYAARNDVSLGGRRTTILMHRQILNLAGAEFGDHKNRISLDCRRKNLRECEKWQNNSNQDLRRDSSTGFKGVSFHSRTGKYQSRVQRQGVREHLGFFDCPIAAAHAYDSAALRLHGEFAKLNFPEEQMTL